MNAPGRASGPRTTPPGLLTLFGAPGIVVLLLFFVVPVAVVLGQSLTGGGAAFARVAADPVFWAGLRGSLAIGTAAPLASVAVGLLVALHLSRLSERVRLALVFLVSLPLTFSGLIIAYGFILVFGRAGFVTSLAAMAGADAPTVGGLIYTPVGLGFAYCYYLVPRVVLVLLPVLLNFDRGQIAAAESLGASRLRAHLDILLPQILPSLVAAFCLCAAVAIGAYGTALALVGTQLNILPLMLYSRISETGTDLPAAAVISVILMAICCTVVALAELLTTRPSRRARTARA